MRGFIFDMDGTLAVGRPDSSGFALLPGVKEFIAELRIRRVPLVVFTNGTAHPPARYIGNLAAAGLTLDPREMMTPSSVAADFFATSAFSKVLVLGGDGVSAPLTEVGITILRPGEAHKPDAVYIGWHPDFRLEDITTAVDAVMAGIPMFVSSDVPFFYTSEGRTLGISGMIAAAIRNATGQRAEVIGKPSAIAAAMAARRLGCDIAQVAIVGDDPQLEIAMARQNGGVGIGVTSGLTDRAAWAAQPPLRRAHHVVDRIDEIATRGLVQLEGR